MRTASKAHTFDDDGVCTRCEFDGAEWHQMMRLGYPVEPQPACELRYTEVWDYQVEDEGRPA